MTPTDEQTDLEDEFPSATDAPPVTPPAADLADGAAEEMEEVGEGKGAVAPEIDTAALEALLLSTHHPLTAAQVADILELPGSRGVKQAIASLNAGYEQAGRSF